MGGGLTTKSLPGCKRLQIEKNDVEIFLMLICILKYIVSHTITRFYTIFLYMTRDRKKLQMQLNFEKRNLKSCNGSLRFIKKGSKLQIFLCNLMQFCAYFTI